MPAHRDSAQLFAVLYQSCPRRDYIRHTALRAMCLLFFVYALIVSILCSAGPVSKDTSLPITILSAVFDCAGVVLGCLSLGFRVHHEKCRVRDDMLRAGAAGDVRALIASLKSAQRRPPTPGAPFPEPPSRLLVFEYANRRYWCVQPRRPDGDVPSTEECLEAAARETGRRKRDMAIGKAYFAMAVAGACLSIAAAVVIPMTETSGVYGVWLSPSGEMVPLFIVSSIALAAAAVVIPIPHVTGISLACAPKPVPAGVMSVNLSGDDKPRMGTRNRAQYQEALPGPPLDELEVETNDGNLQRGEGNVADVSAADANKNKKHAKDTKATNQLWVWGGFANNPSPLAPSTMSTPSPQSFLEEKQPPVPTGPAPAATAPPADDNDSTDSTSSSRVQGHL